MSHRNRSVSIVRPSILSLTVALAACAAPVQPDDAAAADARAPDAGTDASAGPEDASSADAAEAGASDTGTADAAGCVPLATEDCAYAGPAGTLGVGPCRAGTRTCDASGTAFGACSGEVLPSAETCNGIDDDCSGAVDDLPDEDGDGWAVCDGDCCDTLADGCADPTMVNPGAFELPGNGVDDDCDPSTSDTAVTPTCSSAAVLGGVTAMDLVHAMDLCQGTTESGRSWGVISAEVTLSDGTGAPTSLQLGVLDGFGPNVTPQLGTTLAAISSGTARDAGDPGFVHPQNGPSAGQIGNYDAATVAAIPAAFLAAHGGEVPGSSACPSCTGASCAQAFDSVRLHVRMRVPTNARSLSYRVKYYSAEYPEYVCSPFHDMFVGLLTTGASGVPADRNTCVDASGTPLIVDNPFFDVCFPAVGAPPGACAGGTLELVGTGVGGWGSTLTDGGGTTWLTTEAPVVPGEIIELDLIVWDAGDHNVDSTVLLDRFRWSTSTVSASALHR